MLLFFVAVAAAQQDTVFFTVQESTSVTQNTVSTSMAACTDEDACNFWEKSADEECIYDCFGCKDVDACNYNAEAANTDNTVCNIPCKGDDCTATTAVDITISSTISSAGANIALIGKTATLRIINLNPVIEKQITNHQVLLTSFGGKQKLWKLENVKIIFTIESSEAIEFVPTDLEINNFGNSAPETPYKRPSGAMSSLTFWKNDVFRYLVIEIEVTVNPCDPFGTVLAKSKDSIKKGHYFITEETNSIHEIGEVTVTDTTFCTDGAACNHGEAGECSYACYGCKFGSACNYDADAINEDDTVCNSEILSNCVATAPFQIEFSATSDSTAGNTASFFFGDMTVIFKNDVVDYSYKDSTYGGKEREGELSATGKVTLNSMTTEAFNPSHFKVTNYGHVSPVNTQPDSPYTERSQVQLWNNNQKITLYVKARISPCEPLSFVFKEIKRNIVKMSFGESVYTLDGEMSYSCVDGP